MKGKTAVAMRCGEDETWSCWLARDRVAFNWIATYMMGSLQSHGGRG